jgi:hypothetical protein
LTIIGIIITINQPEMNGNNMSTHMNKPNARPGFIVFLSIYLVVASTIPIIFACMLINYYGVGGPATIFFVVGCIGFVVSVKVATGLMAGKKWARIFFIISAATSIIISLSTMRSPISFGGGIVGIGLTIVLVAKMFGDRCDRFFSGLGAIERFDVNENKWQCARCKTYNSLSAAICIKCSSFRTESKPAPQSMAPVTQTQKTNAWKCKSCGTSNDSTHISCSGCGGYK